MTVVFVYGTLMQGERHHGLLAATPKLASARTEASFQLYDLGPYPAMVRGTAHELEDHPTLYRREPIMLDDGRDARAYLYLGALDRAPAIASGDWRRR